MQWQFFFLIFKFVMFFSWLFNIKLQAFLLSLKLFLHLFPIICWSSFLPLNLFQRFIYCVSPQMYPNTFHTMDTPLLIFHIFHVLLLALLVITTAFPTFFSTTRCLLPSLKPISYEVQPRQAFPLSSQTLVGGIYKTEQTHSPKMKTINKTGFRE